MGWSIKGKRGKKCLLFIVFAVTVFALYGQVTTFDFVSFDDFVYVKDNRVVRNGLTLDGLTWAFSAVNASNWHPLTWISHMIDVELFGMSPGKHHLTNVLLHLANSMLLFIFLERTTGAYWRSAIVAALFALHPLHVESVAWISERKDVLSTLFWMLTMLSYSWYVQKRSVARYLSTASCFALGLMAKPMLVTLPFVLLLLDIWPLKRAEIVVDVSNDRLKAPQSLQYFSHPQGVYRLILEKIPLLIMALAVSGLALYAQAAGGSVSPLDRLDMAARMQNALVSYGTYLWKVIFPTNLSVFYPYPKTFSTPAVMGSLILLLVLSSCIVLRSKKFPYLITGWFWYLGTLVPVIGIIQVGSQSLADRYTYIPLIGIFIMVTWGLADSVARWRTGRAALGIVSAVLLAIFAMMTWKQVSVWKDSESLFRHALSVTNGNYLAYNSLGVALFGKGNVDEAIGNYQDAINLKRDYVNAHCNLGVALASRRQYAEALVHYEECLRIRPGYPDARYNMAIALEGMGRRDEALVQYRLILQEYPEHENAHNNMGYLLASRGDLDGAVRHYLEALKTDPHNIRVQINLSDALLQKGDMEEALMYVENALSTEPENSVLYIKMARIQEKMGSPDQAIASYQRAL